MNYCLPSSKRSLHNTGLTEICCHCACSNFRSSRSSKEKRNGSLHALKGSNAHRKWESNTLVRLHQKDGRMQWHQERRSPQKAWGLQSVCSLFFHSWCGCSTLQVNWAMIILSNYFALRWQLSSAKWKTNFEEQILTVNLQQMFVQFLCHDVRPNKDLLQTTKKPETSLSWQL